MAMETKPISTEVIKMSFSNDWSISGVTGMTSLKDAYQWNGVKRLHTLGAIRLSTVIPTDTYTDTAHGAPTTYPLVDYGIGAQKMPLRLDDADSGGVQILIDNNSARMRYFTIPGYRINNKAISGVGEIYANEYENAYNFTPALMYGRSLGTQYNNAKNWNFIEYPTFLHYMCHYVDTLQDPSVWQFHEFPDTSGIFTSDDSRRSATAIYVEKDAAVDKLFFAYQECSSYDVDFLIEPRGHGDPFFNLVPGSWFFTYQFLFSWEDEVHFRKKSALSPYTSSRLKDLFFKRTVANTDIVRGPITNNGNYQTVQYFARLGVSGYLYTPYMLSPRTTSVNITFTEAAATVDPNATSFMISLSGPVYLPIKTNIVQNARQFMSIDDPSGLLSWYELSDSGGSATIEGHSIYFDTHVDVDWADIGGTAQFSNFDVGEKWGTTPESYNNSSSRPWFQHNSGARYYESMFILAPEPVLNFHTQLISIIPLKYSYNVYFGSEKATAANTKGSFTFKAFFYNTSTSNWDLKTVTMTKIEGYTYSTYDPGSNYACYLRFYWETDSTYPSQLVAYDHSNNITTWGNNKVSFYGSYAAPITVRKEAVQIQDGLVLTEVLGYVLYCGNRRAEYGDIVNYFTGGPITGTMDQYNMLTHRWMEGMLLSCSNPVPTSYTQLSSPTAKFGGLALFGDSCRTQWNGMKYQDSCYAFVAVTIDGPVDVDRCYDNMVLSN